MKIVMMIFLGIFAACIDDNLSPEAALKDFVEVRMGNVVGREEILARVTGKLKQSLENISDDDFAKFADLRGVRRNSFKIMSKSCQEKQCFITYSISYGTINQDKTTYASEVKKIAELVNQNGKWLISDVSNVKTYHEALEPINP
jgi:hypothetical protein